MRKKKAPRAKMTADDKVDFNLFVDTLRPRFAVSLAAKKRMPGMTHDIVYTTVAVIRAINIDEAYGRGRRLCFQQYPAEDGYVDQTHCVQSIEVVTSPDPWFRNAMEQKETLDKADTKPA